MLVFRAQLMYVPKRVGGARGGGGCLHRAHYAFPKKTLSPCTTCPQRAHVHQWHIVCKNKIRIGGAHKWAEMLHHPCILGDPQRHGGQNQNWWGPQVGGNATSPLHSRESPKTWGTKSELVGPTSGRKCYITPAFSGIPNKGDKVKAKKKQKKTKTKIFPWCPCFCVQICRMTPVKPHWGLNPEPSSCRGIALPTRVWPISVIPLHRGGIHIWSNLVFIHYWVLLKQLSILSINTWGENPFFHPLLSQATFP